ncbi:hypothetical protein DQR70_06400 [Salmonella enterica subsp. enterica serovar Oslo]|nr:hypothetical protein [Salmonella enterica subsp. enterica serovar Oslo]
MRNNFEITVQRGLNNGGTIKRLDNNYCQVVLGALEYPNSVGAVYDLQSAINIIEKSTIFNRRMEQGYLRGELGHPVERECRDYNDFVRRIHTIDERNVSCHIRRVWIDHQYKGHNGEKIIAILGEVAPSGPHAAALERKLNNPHENVAWSVRSLTNDRIVNGVKRKWFESIVTWDEVNEPGLKGANKFNSPSCESIDVMTLASVPVMPALIDLISAEAKHHHGIGMESTAISMESTIEALHRSGRIISRSGSVLELW